MSSDYRISPFELKNALLEHPAVVEAAVVPCPDPVRSAVPKVSDSDCRLHSRCGSGARYFRLHRQGHRAPQAHPAAGVFRSAEDHFGQDRPAGKRGKLEFFEEDFPDLKT